MKSISSILIILFAITSCTKESPSLSGKAVGVSNGLRMYLQTMDSNGAMKTIDTAIVMDGRFNFGSPRVENHPKLMTLLLDNSLGGFVFVSEDEPLTFDIDKDSLMLSKIDGGKENLAFTNFRNKVWDYSKNLQAQKSIQKSLGFQADRKAIINSNNSFKREQDKIIEEIKQIALNNRDLLVAPTVLDFLHFQNLIDAETSRELYDKFSPAMQSTAVAQKVQEDLLKSENVAIGKKAPYFEGKSPDGRVIKLTESLGRVTLVDFWASWCRPCRLENPNVVKAYDQYHDKGFNIVSISLDRQADKDKWIAAIKNDGMIWDHISRLQQWQDPIAKQYNVTSIPATFLLDENGIIIDKNLRGAALHKRLKELLD